MNIIPVSSSAGQMTIAQRQRALMAEALQQQASTTKTPAGGRGLAVGAAQLAAGLMGGIVEGNTLRQAQAGGQAVRDAQARILEHYAGLNGGQGQGASPAPTAVGQPSAHGAVAGDGYGSVSPKDVEAYIRERAPLHGIDPDQAVRVSGSEGLNKYVGDGNSSFGPYQLHYGNVAGSGSGNQVGGLGDTFTKTTGLDARDPSTWKAQVDFALQQAAQGGWGPWHGWAGDRWAGIGPNYKGPVSPPTATASAVMPASPPAAQADMPAPNAQPVAGNGLPGDMMQNPGAAPIPGSAFAPSADLGGGVVDSNVATSPGSVPAYSDPQQRALASALMQSDPATPALTPANPAAAPGAMGQPADMLNNAPWPSDGGMDSSLGAPKPSPYGQIPLTTGDPAAASLAFALQNQAGGQGTAPSLGTNLDASRTFDDAPGATDAAFGADAGAATAARVGVPAMLGATRYAQQQGGPSFADFSGTIANTPADPQTAANVPLPPVRPPQATLDALGGPPSAPAMASGAPAAPAPAASAPVPGIDPIAAASHAGASPDMPALNAQPAMASGLPGDITAGGPGGGFSPVGKNAGFETPQQFNLAQSGNAGLADALMSYQPGQAPAAPSMSPAQRGALASALQNQGGPAAAGGTGQGSAFGQVMNGADIGSVARQQFANLGGNTDAGIAGGQPTGQGQGQGLALAHGLDPNGGYNRQAMMSDVDAILRSPYASPEERQSAMQLMMPSYSVKDLPDGTTLRINNLTGEATPIYHGQVKHFGATKEGQIYDEFTGGGPNGQPLGTAFRLMTPDEKQAAGLPVDQPFQVGPDGKISGTSGQTINIGGAQSEYEKQMSDAVAKRHVGLMEGVEGAQERARALNEMSDAVGRIQAAGGTTGMGQSDVLRAQSAINSAANVLGFQPFDISDKEVVGKLNKQIAASAAKSLSTRGATNFDFQQMQAANPGLEMSPTANQRLIGLAQQAEQRSVDLGQQIRSYAAQQQAGGRKADPAAVEKMITDYDAGHHFRDPITGQDVTANPKLPEFQGQGGGGQMGAQNRPPVGASAAPPLSQAQQQAASSTSQAQALASARAAIAAGKSRTAVMQRLQQLGINPGSL